MGLSGALCALLLDGPGHGYQLHSTLEAELGPLWETRASQLYLTLGRMERDGLVTSRRVAQGNRPDRLLLELTDLGRAEAERWLGGEAQGSDLVVRMAIIRLVRPDQFAELTDAAAAQRSAVLRQLRSLRAEAADGFQPEGFDAEIGRVAAEVRWLSGLVEHASEVVSRPRSRTKPPRRDAQSA